MSHYYNPNHHGNHGNHHHLGNHYHKAPAPKRSGATYTVIRNGNFKDDIIVNAWNKSKGKGLITATVAPYGKSKVYENKKGQEKMTMIAIVDYKNSGVQKKIPCSMNLDTKVISLEEIGMCITPNGSGVTSGGKRVTGYFGTFKK